jgi:hypothetical protein
MKKENNEEKENLNANLDILCELLDLHYSGIMHISNFYRVGDVIPNVPLRYRRLNEVVDLVVIGIEHDTIAGTNIKAALTLSQVNCLNDCRYMNGNYNDYTYAHYSTSNLRTWINSTYYNALPNTLQDLIKPVDKLTAEPASSREYSTTTLVSSIEKCFIPSNCEVFGTNYYYHRTNSEIYGVDGMFDGMQYEYYKTKKNRLKSVKNVRGFNTFFWWTRSGFITLYDTKSIAKFIAVHYDGVINDFCATGFAGVCPCFCI